MILSSEDWQLYYRLWKPLLDYVNMKYMVNDNIGKIEGAEGLDFYKVKAIAEKLWDNVPVIDEYLAEQGENLSVEHRGIIESWKRRIKGKFILERHLKKGSIFIAMDNEQVYQVSGISTSWEDLLMYRQTPIMLEATFIPFNDVIIPDGLIVPYNIVMGGNMARHYKDIYMNAKKNGLIHRMI